MHFVFRLAAVAALALGAANASAQSVTFNFEDGTDQGFRPKFTDPDTFNYTIANVGGSQRMAVPMVGGAFQQAEVRNDGTALGAAFQAAMDAGFANPTGYLIAYDYYIDTSAGNQGTFLQLGTYVNGNASGLYQRELPRHEQGARARRHSARQRPGLPGDRLANVRAEGVQQPAGQPAVGTGTDHQRRRDERHRALRQHPRRARPRTGLPGRARLGVAGAAMPAAAVDRVRQFHRVYRCHGSTRGTVSFTQSQTRRTPRTSRHRSRRSHCNEFRHRIRLRIMPRTNRSSSGCAR